MQIRFPLRQGGSGRFLDIQWGAAMASLLLAGMAHAAPGHKHVHGTVKLDVAIEGSRLTVELDAPLDSLLGFEHSPRTAAQRQAGAALLEQMKDVQAVVRPDPQALCTLARSRIDAPVLDTAPPAGPAKGGEHADLSASYEFDCAQPEKLMKLDVVLFDTFKRIKRIESRVAGAKGQSGRTLTPATKTLMLAR